MNLSNKEVRRNCRSALRYLVRFVALVVFGIVVGCESKLLDESDLRGSEQEVQVLSDWTERLGTGTVEMRAPGRIRLSADSATNETSIYREQFSQPPANYSYRFRQRVLAYGASQELSLYAQPYLAKVFFESNRIDVALPNGQKQTLWSSGDSAWHEYLVHVQDGMGYLNVDGRFAGHWALVETMSSTPAIPGRIKHVVHGPGQSTIEIENPVFIPFPTSKPLISFTDWTSSSALSGWTPTVDAGSLSYISLEGGLRMRTGSGGSGAPSLARIKRGFTDVSGRLRASFSQRLVSGRSGFVVYTGTHRAYVYIDELGVRVRHVALRPGPTDDATVEETVLRVFQWDERDPYALHQYELDIRKNTALLYVDGAFAGEWHMPKHEASPQVQQFAERSGNVPSEVVLLHTSLERAVPNSTRLEFRFSEYSNGVKPGYWWETDALDTWYKQPLTNSWLVDSQQYAKVVAGSPNSLSLLSYFAQNLTFSGRFKIDSADPEAHIYIQARRRNEEARVVVRYSPNNQRWLLLEKSTGFPADDPGGQPAQVMDSEEAPLAIGKWYKFSMTLDGKTAQFRVDADHPSTPPYSVELTTNKLSLVTFGRIGVQAKNARVRWDNLVIAQENAESGPPIDGVREYAFPCTDNIKIKNGEATVGSKCTWPMLEQLSDGQLLLYTGQSPSDLGISGGNGALLSADGGQTWDPVSGEASGEPKRADRDMLNLPGVGLLVRRYLRDCEPGPAEYLEFPVCGADLATSGACPSGEVPTTSRYTFHGCRITGTMPNKLTLDSQGRLFFVSGESGSGESLTEGRFRVYRTVHHSVDTMEKITSWEPSWRCLDPGEDGQSDFDCSWKWLDAPDQGLFAFFDKDRTDLTCASFGLPADCILPPTTETECAILQKANDAMNPPPMALNAITCINVQEGVVVDVGTADPALRANGPTHKVYMRTDQGHLYESLSIDEGKTWTRPRATPFMSGIASFAVERDPETGHHFMHWVYNDVVDDLPVNRDFYTRNRLSLAMSVDGTRTWRFVGDLDESGISLRYRYYNNSATITKHGGVSYLWILVSSKENWKSDNVEKHRKNLKDPRLWRIDLSKIEPMFRFPGVHARPD